MLSRSSTSITASRSPRPEPWENSAESSLARFFSSTLSSSLPADVEGMVEKASKAEGREGKSRAS